MKSYYKILIVCLSVLFFVGCKEHVPAVEDLPTEAVDFTYLVSDATYQLDYYVGATIKFYPTVNLNTPCIWDFGDGSEKVEGDTVYHNFTVAGTYKVKATANGGTKQNDIMISDILPIVTLVQEDPICEVKSSYISFEVELPNPDNLEAVYKWTFPTGTTNEADEEVAAFEGTAEELGKVKFARVGSQTVQLQVVLGGRNLEVVKKNVQVALNEEAPTLYYAVKEGNIMAMKLPAAPIEGVEIDPYDMGITAGQHPLNILFNNESLYILDAGKQFVYINDENKVMGDGQITIMAKDASSVETMISNVGGPAFQDPFYGFIEGMNLYYSDRNTGMITVPLSTRNAVYNAEAFPYFIQNNYLGYYGRGLAYGAITAGFGKIKDTYYWSKTYNGNGLYRFTASDILTEPVTDKDPIPEAGVVLTAFSPKSFVYDEKNDWFYFTIYGTGEGFYRCKIQDLEGFKDSKTLAPYQITFADGTGCPQITEQGKGEGSSGEFIGICQMALDEATGDIYFGLRSGDSNVKSGLVRYNAATEKLEYLIKDVNVYGVAINAKPAKLF